MDGKKGWWVVFGSIWALSITAGIGFTSIGVLAESIIVGTGWSEKVFGDGIVVWGLTGALCSPFIGKAIDHFGSRPIMIIGIIIAAGAEFGLARATSVNQFYVALGFLGLGTMSCTYIPVAAIAGRWFVKHQAIATGLSMLGLGIGGGLFPFITKLLLDAQGYQGAFTALGGIMLTALIPVLIWIRLPEESDQVASDSDSEEQSTDNTARDLTLFQALKSRSFWGLNLGDLLTGMVFAFFTAFLVLYITKDTGDADHGTLVFSILSFGIGFGILVFGPLGQVFEFRRIFALCYFLPAIGISLLVISDARIAAYSFAVIAGFAGGGRSALFPAALLKSFGGTHMASIYGVSNTLFLIGASAGPALATRLFEATGKTSSVYALSAVVFVVSAILISLIRDERDVLHGSVES